jgi:hypothetical protein
MTFTSNVKIKLTLLSFITLTFLMPTFSAYADTVLLEAGKAIAVKAEKELDADELKAGQNVTFLVESPVKSNGQVVIKAGELVTAVITTRKNNFVFGIPGKLVLTNLKTKTVDGQDVSFRGDITNKGESKFWVNLGWLAPIVFPMVFIKGDDAIITPNTSFTLFTLEDVKVTPKVAQ